MLKKTINFNAYEIYKSNLINNGVFTNSRNYQVKLGHVLPNKFEVYLRIFHPFYFSSSLEKQKITWSDIQKCRNIQTDEIIEEKLNDRYDLTLKDIDDSNYIELKWKDLCKKLNLIYHNEISINTITSKNNKKYGINYPIGFHSPAEGYLENEKLNELVNILKKFTNKKCYFFYYLYMTNDLKDTLYYGDLEEIYNIGQMPENNYNMPEFVWDEANEWAFCMSHDLTSTYVGGSKEIINEFIKNPVFETLEVDINTRVDNGSDSLNK